MSITNAAGVKKLQDDVRVVWGILSNQAPFATKLTDDDKSAWKALNGRVEDFLLAKPGEGSWSSPVIVNALYQDGEKLKADITPWFDKLRAAGAPDVPSGPGHLPNWADVKVTTEETVVKPAKKALAEIEKAAEGGALEALPWLILGYLAYRAFVK
jgi:hypothetical protein